MRLLATLLTLPAALLTTLAAPWVGLVALAAMYYVRPSIWGAPPWLSLVEILTWATLLGFALAAIRGRVRVRVPAVLLLMLALVGWAFLSASGAPLSRTLGYARAVVYLKCAVVGVLIVWLLDDGTKLNRFLWAIVLGTLWTVKSALYLYATANPDRVDRIGGQGGSANFLALILVLSLPLLLALVQAGRRRERTFALVLLPVWFLVMGLTGSRGGFLAMGVEILALLWLCRRKGLALAFTGLLALLFVAIAPDRYFERMETIDDYRRDASAMGRIELWRGALTLSGRHPVLGVGPGNFPLHSGAFTPHPGVAGREGLVAHSLYFETLAELGRPGLALLVLMMWLAFRAFLRAGRDVPDTPEGRRFGVTCRALAVAFVGLAAHSAVMSNLHRDVLWWWIGLAGAVPAIARRLAAEAADSAPVPAAARESTAPAPMEVCS